MRWHPSNAQGVFAVKADDAWQSKCKHHFICMQSVLRQLQPSHVVFLYSIHANLCGSLLHSRQLKPMTQATTMNSQQ